MTLLIIDGVKYKSTRLYEFIFKRILDNTIYIENDKLAYKSILLATNAHRRSHKGCPILDIERYKHKNIIASLVSGKIQVGTGMRLETKQQVR